MKSMFLKDESGRELRPNLHHCWCYACQSWVASKYILDPTGWQHVFECECGEWVREYSVNGLVVKVYHPGSLFGIGKGEVNV